MVRENLVHLLYLIIRWYALQSSRNSRLKCSRPQKAKIRYHVTLNFGHSSRRVLQAGAPKNILKLPLLHDLLNTETVANQILLSDHVPFFRWGGI